MKHVMRIVIQMMDLVYLMKKEILFTVKKMVSSVVYANLFLIGVIIQKAFIKNSMIKIESCLKELNMIL